ncbi:hypothetical protein NRI_0501 [Neorickettsia risticii str. Illinois]|uniref:Uncharacterized protein n=1 Tax=Neorickettsia risticii (strain Illinois) TaxID=434131 RepID=C6V516_NEORI|nr:hypothetical protein NRI_0501 [Neorickettsia risticii str. Illinois]
MCIPVPSLIPSIFIKKIKVRLPYFFGIILQFRYLTVA